MTDFAALSDADLMAMYKQAKDPFESALSAEGIKGPVADIARSIYQQESSSGKNTKTSNAGAVGGMQIIPGTFKSVADKDWNINDPVHNARAGVRYVKQLFEQAGGDPALTAAGYYGGPGGLEKARRGVAVSDPRNPNAPTTLQYGQQVAARIPKEKGLVQRGVEAMIPSAEAAEPPKNSFESMSDEDLLAAYQQLKSSTPAKPEAKGGFLQGVGNVAAGAVRGAGSIGATILAPYDMAKDALDGKGLSLESNRQRRADMDAGLESMGAQPDSMMYQGGKLAGEIAGTAGVGSTVALPLKAAGVVPKLAAAISSSGAASPGVNMLTRMTGGAISGGASAGLIDPSAGGIGAGIGATLPPSVKVVGSAANALGSLVRPFYASGQNQIAGNALREFATDPTAARTALSAASEVVPGSAPIAATAAGDDGIAALSRAMQNASPEYASNLSARQTAQNQARTVALEGIAGNTGKIDVAKAARDAATGPMREKALNAAGKVPATNMLAQIDNMLADPNNAGQLSQQALGQFKGRISEFSKDGTIDARALYAIRKDINDVLGGKLQGDAGNIKFAASQLGGVKGLIDDAIDQASKAVPQNALGPTTGAPNWKGYLKKYADESIPIRQMEKLDDILKSIQTGTVDSQGSAVLSAAKLNNVLKNKGSDLVKELSPQQLDVLRKVQADLNAGQIANNTGRAVGSNTVQNLAQNQLLQSTFGKAIGGSTAASSTLGRLMQLPYGTANKQIQERLGNALLNPQEAARLLAQPQNNKLAEALALPAYRAAPAISAR